MKHQFDVTLQYFVINDGCAMAAPGAAMLGKLSSLELLQVLMIFQEMNPVQNFTAEPQIQIQVKGGKFFVRTDLNRLLLYNSRKLHEPALVMEPQQIITEIDDSAAQERDALLRKLNKAGGVATLSATSGSEAEKPVLPGSWLNPVPWLSGLAICLAWGCVSLARMEWGHASLPEPACTLISDRDQVLYRRDALAGLYVTGNTPGHHAIVVLANGNIRFMQVNASGPSSEIRDDYEILSGDEGLYLRTSQTGGLIHVESKMILRYCGEAYRRQY